MTLALRLCAVAICAIAASWVSAVAHAGVVPLTNSTFSDPAQGSFMSTPGSFSGWTTGGNGGVLNYTPYNGAPNEGPYWPTVPGGTTFAYSNGDNLTQITTSSLGLITPGTTYQLTVSVGEGIGFTPLDNTIALILPNGFVLNSLTAPNTIGYFSIETLKYTAPLSGPVLDQQIGVQLGSAGVQSNFDSVVLSTVPEPGSFMVWGVCFGAVALIRRRMRRRTA